jgi:hypothetical protein
MAYGVWHMASLRGRAVRHKLSAISHMLFAKWRNENDNRKNFI